jgi:hypothetical protein
MVLTRQRWEDHPVPGTGGGGAVRRAVVVVTMVVLLAVGTLLGLRALGLRLPGARTSTPTGSPAVTATATGSTAASRQPADDAGAAAWAAAVTRENAMAGTSNWQIHSTAGKAKGLEAYADRVSVRPGDPVGLYVAGSGTVRARALRIGWYGGVGARTVWSGSLSAGPQPAPTTFDGPIPDAGGLAGTRTVVAPWHQSTALDTTGWPEGQYLLRLDARGASRYVPLTVRSSGARDRVLVVPAPLTWQAYNGWGGRSLYDAGDRVLAHRSLAVSFDRPYADGYGAGRFLTYDAPVVRLAERLGLPLAWASDYDLAARPDLVRGAAAVVLGGHAEYWTGPMRDAVTSAMGAGTNLAVFGANTAYWRVRMAGRTIGLPGAPQRRDGTPRVLVGTKEPGADPLAARDPGGATARFRDAPAPRREEALTGMRYDCYPAEADWVVADPSWWGYAGTGVHAGERLRGVVGPEADRVYPVPGRPTPEQVVAYTRYSCGGHETAHTGVYWVTPSGAGVFAAGTMRWPAAMAGEAAAVPDVRAAAVLARVSSNVLTAFATARAGTSRPARENVGRFWLPTTVTSRAA